MESYVFKIIHPGEIRSEFPYSCRYRLHDQPLLDSVAKRGIMTPVIVTSDAERTLVSGHKRLAAAETAGLKKIPVFEINESLSSHDLFLFALVANWNQAWSDLDRIWTIRKAVETYGMSEVQIVEEVFPCLGLPPEKGIYDESVRIGRLNSELLDLIAEGKLPLRGVRILTRFCPADQRDFARLVAFRAALTTNQLLQAGEWLYDLLKTSETNVASYLKEHGLDAILEHSSWDRRCKGEQFYRALRALRFPRIVDQERKFESFSHSVLPRSEELRLEAPAAFEDEGFVLRAKVRSPESLDHILDILARQKTSLNSFFDIML